MCCLAFTTGPREVILPVKVDWEAWPTLLLDHSGRMAPLCNLFEQWMDEYGTNIHTESPLISAQSLFGPAPT